MCVSILNLLITSGVMRCDTDPDWLNKFYSFYMVAVVGIICGHDLSNNNAHTRNQSNRSKLSLYKPLILALT